MKKLYVLLSYAVCLSSTFSAVVSPSSEFDDCSRALSPMEKGLVAPQNTPQLGPKALEEADSLMQLLPAAEQADEGGAVAPQAPLKVEEGGMDSALISVKKPEPSPDLKIYYTERDGDETSLKRFTTDMLAADYEALSPGEVLEAKFMPEIILQDATRTRVDQPVSKSFFDTIGWLANIRAWAKWWLNPWAWWSPSAYSLDANSDSIEWDGVAGQATIRLTRGKDVTYLSSQLRLFLLKGWGAKFAPYVAPVTQKTLERAVMVRFENIEKPALEAIGFKDVTLGTWVNPRTQQLERVIRAIK